MRRFVWLCLAPALLVGCGTHDSIVRPEEPPVRPPSQLDWPAFLSPAPAWSSQGRIAYYDVGIVPTDGAGGWDIDTALAGLWTIDPETGSRTRMSKGGAQPAWSPDGQRLLCVVGGHDGYVVANMRADGTDRREVTSHGYDFDPDWSSRNRIAYTYVDVIRTVSPEGLADVDLVQGSAPSWHPDGTHLVFARDFPKLDPPASTIWVTTLTADTPVCLLRVEGCRVTSPRYSPDGTRIAFSRVSSESGPEQIWVMQADGVGARPVTTGGGREPAWSPDGTRIVFVRDALPGTEGFAGDLWIVEVATGTERQLTSHSSLTRASPR